MPRHALIARRAAAAVLTVGLSVGLAAVVTAPDAGAATVRLGGSIGVAIEDTWHHVLKVEGVAYDRGDESRSLQVAVFADGRYVGQFRAGLASPAWSRAHHLPGRHAFNVSFPARTTVHRVVIVAAAADRSGALVRNARHTQPAAGARIVEVAKRYVGKARYVEGGSSPTRGFDCSGYTRWAYQHARVRTLPHNAEAQRHVRGMHRISRKSARPGDLIFYFAGGPAYHVAIYAGHGMQYAAATPRDGIRYQKIWSRNIEFRTLTH